MASIFDTVRKKAEELRSKAQQGIQNWAQANPQSAQRIINAPQQLAKTYTNTYQKVSPYVPFAPKITTPQQTQKNYNTYVKPIVNTVKNNISNTPLMSFVPFIGTNTVNLQKNLGEKPITIGDIKRMSTPEGQQQLLKEKGGNINQYLVNRYGAPISQVPYNFNQIISPKTNLGQKAMGVLGVASGVFSAYPDPIGDVALPFYDLYKGSKAYQLANKNRKLGTFEALTKGGIPAMTLEKPVGIGETLTTNKSGQLAWNLAELPLIFLATSKISKYKNILDMDDIKEVGAIANRASKNWITKAGKADISQMAKDESLVDTILQNKYKAPISELKKVPLYKKINILYGIAMEDLRGGPKFQPGFSTQELTGVIPTKNNTFIKKGNLLSSFTDRVVTSGRSVLNKMGKTGQEIANKIDNMYNTTERMVGTATGHYKQLTNNLDDAGLNRVSASLNGEKVSLTPQEEQAVKGLRPILDAIWTRAKELGLNPGRKENYFPNIPNINKLAANREATAQYFVKTKQIPNIEKALSFIDDIINGVDVETAYVRLFGKAIPKVSGFLEKSRLFEWPTQVIRTDRGVIPEYFQNVFSRLNQVEQFGKNNEIGEKLLLDLTKQGYSVNEAKNILNQNLGLTIYDPILSKGLGIVRSVQSLMKMPLGAITNASQSVNTASVYGIRRTLKSIFDQVTGKASQQESYALRTGAITDATMQEILDTWKGKGALAKFAAPGFSQVEKFNRIISANVGADYANQLANQIKSNPKNSKAISELTKLIGKFDINNIIKEGLSEEQLLKAGQTATNVTQFKTRPIDMPSAWNSPMGKTLTQFKNFAFKQAEFIKDQIIAPALKGNFGPLSRYILLSMLVGEGVIETKNLVKGGLGAAYQTGKTALTEGRLPTKEELTTSYEQAKGKPRPTDLDQRALQNFGSVGSFGLITDAFNALSAASQFGSRAILEFIVGPTGTDVARTATDIAELGQGKPRNFVRNTLRSIPFIGQPIANIEYPKAADDSVKMGIPEQLQKIKTGFELEPYKLMQQNAEVKRGNTSFKIFNEVKDLSNDELKTVLQKYADNGILTKDIYVNSLLPKLKEYKLGVSASEKSVKNLGVDAEAKYHYDKTKNMSLEEKRTYFQSLADKKLITKETYKAYLKLLKAGGE